MYYVVTGAAGFNGANLVKGLNGRGITDIIAVDDLTQGDKFVNLVDIHPKHKKSGLELVLTVLHAGGKFGETDSGYVHSGGLQGGQIRP